MSVGSVVVAVLLVLGVGLQVVACIGVAAMRDTYARLHYPGVGGFGLAAIAAAIAVDTGPSMIGDKAVAAAAIVLVTGPLLTHVTARSCRKRRLGDWTIRPGERVERIER